MIITPIMEDAEFESIDKKQLKDFVQKYEKELKSEDWKSIINSIENDRSAYSKARFQLIKAIFSDILGKNILTKLDHIPNLLFSGDDTLTSIEIPENITSIADNAFKDCKNLEKVYIHDNVKTLGDSVFSGCSKLSEVRLPETLELIPNKAFYGCSALKYLYIPDSVKRAGYDVFYGWPEDAVIEMNRGVNRAEGPDDPHPNAIKMKTSSHDFLSKHIKWKNAQ